MAVLSTTTKGVLGFKTAKGLAKNPQWLKTATPIAKTAITLLKPVAERRARRQVKQAEKAARQLGTTLTVSVPRAAYELGLAEPPKPKRATPFIVTGAVLGAGAMYLLEPGAGSEHRRQLAKLVA